MDVVHKDRKHLVARALELVRGIRDVQGDVDTVMARGATVFHQMLEGYLLTLAYSSDEGHQLGILNWRNTEPGVELVNRARQGLLCPERTDHSLGDMPGPGPASASACRVSAVSRISFSVP